MVKYAVLRSGPSSSSLLSPPHFHLPPSSPSARSERREGLHTASHINLQLEMFSSLTFRDSKCVCTVELMGMCARVWFCGCLQLMCTVCVCVCVCVFQGVAPLTQCQQRLLLIGPGRSSISELLIRLYKPHTSNTTKSCRIQITSVCLFSCQHLQPPWQKCAHSLDKIYVQEND